MAEISSEQKALSTTIDDIYNAAHDLRKMQRAGGLKGAARQEKKHQEQFDCLQELRGDVNKALLLMGQLYGLQVEQELPLYSMSNGTEGV